MTKEYVIKWFIGMCLLCDYSTSQSSWKVKLTNIITTNNTKKENMSVKEVIQVLKEDVISLFFI